MHEAATAVHPNPLGIEVTMYPSRALPPVFVGAAHVNCAVVPDAMIPVNAGASGTPCGVTIER